MGHFYSILKNCEMDVPVVDNDAESRKGQYVWMEQTDHLSDCWSKEQRVDIDSYLQACEDELVDLNHVGTDEDFQLVWRRRYSEIELIA